jgi:hypothetical protein
MRSTSSPNSSMRTRVSSYAGKTSIVSPRTRNLPRVNVEVVALVLDVDQLAQDRVAVDAPRPRSAAPAACAYSSGEPRP